MKTDEFYRKPEFITKQKESKQFVIRNVCYCRARSNVERKAATEKIFLQTR